MTGRPNQYRRLFLSGSLAAAAVLWLPDTVSAAPDAKGNRTRRPAKPAPRTIVLDPGHGGSDPGAIASSGAHEKSIVLGFAQLLEQRLTATGRYRVVHTRRGDAFVPLRARVDVAKTAKADLFVSLHADWHPDSETRGASIYTLSEEASDRESAALAMRENRAGALKGVDLRRQPDTVAEVLISMAQRDTINASRRFADITVEQLDRRRIQLLPRAHRQAGFAVLTAADIPAALVELGYLSNRQDVALLSRRDHQQRLAISLTDAVDRFFGAEPTPAPPPAAKKT